jgi:hypothetical protein
MNADLALPPVMVVRTDDTEDSSMPRKLCFSVGTLEKKLSLFFLLNWMPIFIIDVFCNVTGEEFFILQLFFKCVSVFFFFFRVIFIVFVNCQSNHLSSLH